MLLRALELLDLSDNKLEELPNGVGGHAKLRNLNLKGNA